MDFLGFHRNSLETSHWHFTNTGFSTIFTFRHNDVSVSMHSVTAPTKFSATPFTCTGLHFTAANMAIKTIFFHIFKLITPHPVNACTSSANVGKLVMIYQKTDGFYPSRPHHNFWQYDVKYVRAVWSRVLTVRS